MDTSRSTPRVLTDFARFFPSVPGYLAALTAGGIVASGRADNARIAFHLWNTQEDVELLTTALAK